MLRELKLGVVSAASRSGLTRLIAGSNWRHDRLLILCYHGISLRDEHLWAPALYMEQRLLRSRMELLRRGRYNVLPLAEAVERLYSGELPERSVAVTFDDGWQNFHGLALPVLKEYGIPTTVYLTTYYSNFNRPVFDTTVNYLLWKAQGRSFSLRSMAAEPILLDGPGTAKAAKAIRDYVRREQLSGQEKDELQAELAEHLGIDFSEMLREKFMHLMTPQEVKEIAEAGVDVQFHTHRHRVSVRQDRFNREIEDNRGQIRSMTGTDPKHFCYPGGNFLPQFEGWLSALGVASATTCVAGLCTKKSNRYALPRLLDSATIQESEFDAWLSGLAEFLPKRHYAPAEGQFVENWEAESLGKPSCRPNRRGGRS
jgi:peptidoglycan/xylan/chitin deacetylase (PgdA/CDA1 family)